MKYIATITLILLSLSLRASAWRDSTSRIISVSINNSGIGHMKPGKFTGVGISITDFKTVNRSIKLATSFEYNRLNQFFEDYYTGQHQSQDNVFITTNFFTIQFAGRLQPFNSSLISLEFGPYGELLLFGKERGTMSHDLLDGDTVIGTESFEYSHSISKKLNYGLYASMNIKINIKDILLEFRPGIKYGLHNCSINQFDDNIRYFKIDFGFIL